VKITLHRTDARRYWTAIERDDGAGFEVRGIGFMGAVPHDLAHFTVESELGLANGFWGTVAAGGIFASMHATSGKRPFQADAKSAAVIRTNRTGLNDAELLVGAFTDALDQGIPALLMMLHRFQKGSAIKDAVVSDAEAVRVLEKLREMQKRWRDMPIEGELSLVWQAPRAGAVRRKRA
jgi:hypothetical protein